MEPELATAPANLVPRRLVDTRVQRERLLPTRHISLRKGNQLPVQAMTESLPGVSGCVSFRGLPMIIAAGSPILWSAKWQVRSPFVTSLMRATYF